MRNKVRAVVRDGKLDLLDPVEIPDGTSVVVTILPEDESPFWINSSQSALDEVWNNSEDDVYAELLKK